MCFFSHSISKQEKRCGYVVPAGHLTEIYSRSPSPKIQQDVRGHKRFTIPMPTRLYSDWTTQFIVVGYIVRKYGVQIIVAENATGKESPVAAGRLV